MHTCKIIKVLKINVLIIDLLLYRRLFAKDFNYTFLFRTNYPAKSAKLYNVRNLSSGTGGPLT